MSDEGEVAGGMQTVDDERARGVLSVGGRGGGEIIMAKSRGSSSSFLSGCDHFSLSLCRASSAALSVSPSLGCAAEGAAREAFSHVFASRLVPYVR